MNDAVQIAKYIVLGCLTVIGTWMLLRVAGRAFARGWREEMRRRSENNKEDEG
jgi:hypothetical protein